MWWSYWWNLEHLLKQKPTLAVPQFGLPLLRAIMKYSSTSWGRSMIPIALWKTRGYDSKSELSIPPLLYCTTFCYAGCIQVKLNFDLGKIRFAFFIKNGIMDVYSTSFFHIIKWRYVHTKLICFELHILLYFIIHCKTRFITFYCLFCISDFISDHFSTLYSSLRSVCWTLALFKRPHIPQEIAIKT